MTEWLSIHFTQTMRPEHCQCLLSSSSYLDSVLANFCDFFVRCCMQRCFLQAKYVADCMTVLKKLSKTISQPIFSINLHSFRTTSSPNPYSDCDFLPWYLSNSKRYPVVQSQGHHILKPHFMGLLRIYCFIEFLSLNLIICSSILCCLVGSLASWKHLLKCFIKGRIRPTQEKENITNITFSVLVLGASRWKIKARNSVKYFWKTFRSN